MQNTFFILSVLCYFLICYTFHTTKVARMLKYGVILRRHILKY